METMLEGFFEPVLESGFSCMPGLVVLSSGGVYVIIEFVSTSVEVSSAARPWYKSSDPFSG